MSDAKQLTLAAPVKTRTRLALCIALALAAQAARADDPFLRRTAAVRAVERVGPSVVNVTTESVVQGQPFQRFRGDPFFDRFFQDLFEPRLPRKAQSLGSGVVIDAAGHVLTNEHVVARADVIRVTLADGREFEAKLVGADPNNDLAVLQLQGHQNVPWTAPGGSGDMLVGEPVIAIGNPFGLSNSVTTGVVSALNRSLRTEDRVFNGFLQTDASINPGNSGGPLLNAEGELVGINTAIYQGAQGIGFAIPIDTAKRVVHELLTRGEVAPVWLGVDLQDLDARLVELMQLPPRLGGALVSQVREDGPAAGSGLARGDVITKVDGSALQSARDFYDFLGRTTPGQQLTLSLWRAGAEKSVRVTPREIPEAALRELGEARLGLSLKPHKGGGYEVTAVREGSGAARIGIQPGDLVLGINGRALDDPASLRRCVLDLQGRDRALVVVARGRGRYHVTLPLS